MIGLGGTRVHPPADDPPFRLDALQKGVVLFLVAFLLVFPKGGFKIAGVPLTWGYLGLGLVFLSFPLVLLSGRAVGVLRTRLLVLAALVPFQLVSWLGLLGNGIADLGFGISFVVTFFFIPLVFVLVLGAHLDRIDLTYLLRLVRIAIPLVAAYGIFLFFYKMFTGSYIEIPFLTVNVDDVGTLGDKHNNRGGVFKLISTYNNGNIYGICMMMLLPLYSWMERSTTRKVVVKASVLLSLSRTAWAGLIFYEFLERLYVKRPSVRSVLVLTGWLALAAGGVAYGLYLLDRDVATFLLDRTLGGREGQWAELEDTTILPSQRFMTILEITYLSVLHNFGIVGLATFLLGVGTPLFLYAARCIPFRGTEYKKSIVAGMVVYLFMSMGDGGILYIPIAAFFWFLVSLLLSKNPSFAGVEDRGSPEASSTPSRYPGPGPARA